MPRSHLLDNLNIIEPVLHSTVLGVSERDVLLSMCYKIYPNCFLTQVGSLARMCTKVRHLGVTFSVSSCRAERSACVSAQWCFSESNFEEPVLDPNADLYPGTMEKVSCKFKISGLYFSLHPHPIRHFFGRPSEVLNLSGAQIHTHTYTD